VLYYALSAATNHFEVWNNNLYSGIIPSEWLGNIFLVFHILLAAVILFGGPLQFINVIRRRHPSFHRYLGRIYVILGVLIGLTGVFMTIQGKSFGTVFIQWATAFSSIYICWFTWKTYQNARKKKFNVHQKWAFRLFLVNNGVWFIRVWSSAWKVLTNGTPGKYPEELTAFLTYIMPIPLLLYELYLYAIKRENTKLQWLTVFVISIFTLVMIAGIYKAIDNMWLKKVLNVLVLLIKI